MRARTMNHQLNLFDVPRWAFDCRGCGFDYQQAGGFLKDGEHHCPKCASKVRRWIPAADVTDAFTDGALPGAAKTRLGGQNLLVLQRLEKGPATNAELERTSRSRRINSRIADVRKWLKQRGKTIRSSVVDTSAGIYQYEIVSDSE